MMSTTKYQKAHFRFLKTATSTLLLAYMLVSCSGQAEKKTTDRFQSRTSDTTNQAKKLKQELEKTLQSYPQYFLGLSSTGMFNSDDFPDQLIILYPSEELDRITSKCIILLGNANGSKELVFDDLLPSHKFSGKIENPFEFTSISRDTLFVSFLSSPYGRDEMEKQEFTFRYRPDKEYFSLVRFRTELCLLPDCDQKATLQIEADEMKKRSLPFHFLEWNLDGFNSRDYLIKKERLAKWKKYANELNQLGTEFEFREENIRELIANQGFK